jgi:hypothetical protein
MIYFYEVLHYFRYTLHEASTLTITPQSSLRLGIMMLNVTFSNISAISWRSVLLVRGRKMSKIVHQTGSMLPYFYSKM